MTIEVKMKLHNGLLTPGYLINGSAGEAYHGFTMTFPEAMVRFSDMNFTM